GRSSTRWKRTRKRRTYVEIEPSEPHAHPGPKQRSSPHRGRVRYRRCGRPPLRTLGPDDDLPLPVRALREQAVLRRLAQTPRLRLGMRGARAAASRSEARALVEESRLARARARIQESPVEDGDGSLGRLALRFRGGRAARPVSREKELPQELVEREDR